MLQRPPLCPEIRLWLLGDGVDLEADCRELHDGEPAPYWAFCWGSGQALARFVLDHPEEVAHRCVVDFGAGSGVVAIAAALAGARRVVAVDRDRNALDAIAANAAANRVVVEAATAFPLPGRSSGLVANADLALAPDALAPDDWEVLLASDVLYEPSTRAIVLHGCGTGRRVLVSEPDRPGAGGYGGTPLERYAVTTLPDVDSPTVSAGVYRMS